jgi:integrase
MIHPNPPQAQPTGVPMSKAAELHEPSFADLLAALETTNGQPEQTRRHWLCSVRQIVKAVDKPPELVPARWTSVRFVVARLGHAALGVTPKTLANHKSNVRAALLWFRNEQDGPVRGAPLSPEWRKLAGSIAQRGPRARLYGLMRYCSARQIPPEDVSEEVLDRYMAYRVETTALKADAAARRSIARVWNQYAGQTGWPSRHLGEPPIKTGAGPRWEDFPEGLQTDIERYLAGFTKSRRGASGKRIPPCRASTIRTRRAELIAVVKTAVSLGNPLESLASLGTLLRPDVSLAVLDAYWKRNGEEPSIFTIDLGWKLHSIAREIGCLEPSDLERLDDARVELDHFRRSGLTEKNLGLIRQVRTEGIWRDIVNLPAGLMKRARGLQEQAPVKAALRAQLAVAIAILSVAPVRLGNLVAIRLGENLIKPRGPSDPYWLVFPDYDVKNRVPLQFELDEWLTELIDEYVHQHRAVLLRGSNQPWLFPGESGGSKTANMFGTQITEEIEKTVGIRMTAHQFRHAAAAIFLKHRPGEYEIVRRLLGHRNIQTTTRFYCGLESIQATQIFGRIIRDQMGLEAGAV